MAQGNDLNLELTPVSKLKMVEESKKIKTLCMNREAINSIL